MDSKTNSIINLVGEQFDRLEVIEYSRYSETSKCNVWRCRCKCGTELDVLQKTLMDTKHIHSCGCYQKQFLIPGTSESVSRAGKARAASNPDGINMAMLNKIDTISTNTSGCTGVSWSTSAHKYHVYIGYKNYRCNLGFIEDYDDAVELRKKAVEAINEGTFEELFYELRGFRIEEKLQKLTKKTN